MGGKVLRRCCVERNIVLRGSCVDRGCSVTRMCRIRSSMC